MTGRLEGKVAMVTGAGSGIGRASALIFAQEGAKVVVSDIMVEGGSETVTKIQQAGGEASFFRADVSNEAEVEALIKHVIDTYGSLDCAVNNAGIEGETGNTSEQMWERVTNINLKGAWLCMKHELPQMIRQGRGAIVNTASVAGLIGIQGSGLSPYGPSKAGMIQLTRDAAVTYAKAGIRVNAVCPGVINTAMVQRAFEEMPAMRDFILNVTPMGRMGESSEIGEAIVWLCSDAASYVTGVALPVDGGWTTQ